MTEKNGAMPKRIQRKRTKGWKMPENAVYVGRPTIFGNPFSVKKYGRELSLANFRRRIEADRSTRHSGQCLIPARQRSSVLVQTFRPMPCRYIARNCKFLIWGEPWMTADKEVTKKENSMNAMAPVSPDDPRMKAWELYKSSSDYENTKRWALHEKHVEGSLWASFIAGFKAVGTQAQAAQPETFKLLELMYDKWEEGTQCYEDPEDCTGFLGHAIKLTLEEENRIIAVLKSGAPVAALEGNGEKK